MIELGRQEIVPNFYVGAFVKRSNGHLQGSREDNVQMKHTKIG
jgi:hypothetical protein